MVKDWMTSHFGRNPRKGGNPPRERKEQNIIILVFEPSWVRVNIWFKWFSWKWLNMRIKEILIKE